LETQQEQQQQQQDGVALKTSFHFLASRHRPRERLNGENKTKYKR